MRIDRKAFRMAEGGTLEVLRDVAFALPARSFTCLIGPSGCGKTTTLRILLGLDRDFSGHVDPRLATARIAAVFQEPRLLPWRTVEENIRLALPEALVEAPLAPILDAVGLAEAARSYPAELSLGMARRAALARAFAVEPEVLALDEPFVSLDEATAGRLRELLLELWRARPTTVLMVTHNLREAVALSERILILGGRPAGIMGDVEVPPHLAAGGTAGVEAFLADLAGRFPGLVGP